MELILAVVLGTAFGFVLNRVGATNPQNIINMLRLTDLHLMKTILFAIGFASLTAFAGLALGLIDPGHFSIKAAYLGVFIGGALLGIGFAIAGYCPGTGLAAAATGRSDGWVFVLGGLAGALAYMLAFSWVEATGILAPLWGGSVTLATISAKYPALLAGTPALAVAGGIGLMLIAIAAMLPAKLRK